MGHIIFTCVVLFLLRLNEPATSFDNLPYVFGSLLGNVLIGMVVLSISKWIVKPKDKAVPTGNAVVAFIGASLIASGFTDYRARSELNDFQSAFNEAINQNITGITAAQDGIYDEIDVTALEIGDLERAARMEPIAASAEIMRYMQYRSAEIENEYTSSTNSVDLDNLLAVNKGTTNADYQFKFGEINKLIAALGRYVTERQQLLSEVRGTVTQSGWSNFEKQEFLRGMDNSPVDPLVVENLSIEGDVLGLMRQYLEILRDSDWIINADGLYLFESEESFGLFQAITEEMQEKVDRQTVISEKILEAMREQQSRVNNAI